MKRESLARLAVKEKNQNHRSMDTGPCYGPIKGERLGLSAWTRAHSLEPCVNIGKILVIELG